MAGLVKGLRIASKLNHRTSIIATSIRNAGRK